MELFSGSKIGNVGINCNLSKVEENYGLKLESVVTEIRIHG